MSEGRRRPIFLSSRSRRHGSARAFQGTIENRERIDADIEAARKYAEEMRAKAGPSRLEEKLRQRKADATGDPLPPG
jgi:hypothetical protein